MFGSGTCEAATPITSTTFLSDYLDSEFYLNSFAHWLVRETTSNVIWVSVAATIGGGVLIAALVKFILKKVGVWRR